MKIKQKVIAASLTAVLSVGAFGFAVADAGQKGAGPNSAGASDPSPQAVPATSAGMPPTAQLFWAVVNADASKARSFPAGVTSVQDISGPGTYRVTFPHTVNGCAFSSTLGLAGNAGVEQDGSTQVVTANVSASQVYVTTRDGAGNLAARGFHLLVAC